MILDAVYNNQASSRFHSFLDLQQPVAEKIDAGLADPYYPSSLTSKSIVTLLYSP